ncbi:L,D-transpeptidase [Pseudonocardia spirodelae]|uniref:L,D-transpeptidase n=1 Tax=Pseudonocardia spirodelae TaxID=3133431 RepID=A0ABU8T9Q7_9PSEU
MAGRARGRWTAILAAVTACAALAGAGVAAADPADPAPATASSPARPEPGTDATAEPPAAEPTPEPGGDAAAEPTADPSAEPSTEPSGEPAATVAPAPATGDLVAGTPCTSSARACVDLATRRAWLFEDGKFAAGPVPMRPGPPEAPTPTGTFAVQWKAEQWTSRERLTQMPWSVFFADGGVAFHQGDLDEPSAGCVKLGEADAQRWFDYLQVGDQVQVH